MYKAYGTEQKTPWMNQEFGGRGVFSIFLLLILMFEYACCRHDKYCRKAKQDQ